MEETSENSELQKTVEELLQKIIEQQKEED